MNTDHSKMKYTELFYVPLGDPSLYDFIYILFMYVPMAPAWYQRNLWKFMWVRAWKPSFGTLFSGTKSFRQSRDAFEIERNKTTVTVSFILEIRMFLKHAVCTKPRIFIYKKKNQFKIEKRAPLARKSCLVAVILL